MSIRKLLFQVPIFCMMVAFLCPALRAQAYMTQTGYAEFESSAPLLTFTGTSNHLQGLIDLDENLIDFYLDLNTLETGIGRRDRDMKTQYLETEEYPFAEFTGSLDSPFNPAVTDTQQVTVTGTFKVHGVEKEISINGTLTPAEDGTLHLEAGWTLLLSDYDIERPSIVFYQLADEQVISLSADLEPVEDDEN